MNDATRELGGTLGVAVVGSIFSSVYASHLADSVLGRLPGDALTQAQNSVGAATAFAGGSAQMQQAVRDSFMSGLSASTIVIGVLCLAGAVVASRVLPGRQPAAPAVTESRPEPVPALGG